MVSLLWIAFFVITVKESVSKTVRCYMVFDLKSGQCSDLLGQVKTDDCCLNPFYGYMDAEGSCKSCRPALWSEWTPWGPCSVSCMEGVKQRRRRCDGIGSCGDDDRLGELQTKSCTDQDCCPELGSWSEWGSWQPCSVTCEAGERKKHRTCTQPSPKCGGSCVGRDFEVEPCDTGVICPIHGGWSSWEGWQPCSGTCKEGSAPPTKTRFRSCSNPKPSVVPPGQPCKGSEIDRSDCTQLPFCPVPGNWGPWTERTACSVTCGVGLIELVRKCDNPTPKYGGQPCHGNATALQICSTAHPCPVDGVWSSWGPWETCKAGGLEIHNCSFRLGKQRRQRWCEHRDWNGKKCDGDITDNRNCYNINCKMEKSFWSEWSEWSLCQPPCGDGSIRSRQRECKPDLSDYLKRGKADFYGNPVVDCTPLPAEEKLQTLPCKNVPSCKDSKNP